MTEKTYADWQAWAASIRLPQAGGTTYTKRNPATGAVLPAAVARKLTPPCPPPVPPLRTSAGGASRWPSGRRSCCVW